jgi:bis(5'-nucleosyl)-tetraphosphatase (symmetrical)
VSFDPHRDILWCVGDLINRGPHSLEVLRLLRQLGDSAICVLGNHDLTLLAAAEGFFLPRANDTFQTVLDAPDAPELLEWLRHRPMLHHDADVGFTMVHAGLPPQWDLPLALACAHELEVALRGPDYRSFLSGMFGDEPNLWRDDLQGNERLRFITNALTRMRFCTTDGRLCLVHKGKLGSQPPNLVPWFRAPGRRSRDLNIVFGHWAALGLHREPGIFALDTGCGWGGELVALRLDAAGEPPVSVDCREMRREHCLRIQSSRHER